MRVAAIFLICFHLGGAEAGARAQAANFPGAEAERAPLTGPIDPAAPQDIGAEPLQDPYLAALLQQAVMSHPSISAARASVRAAGADIRAARWQAFPSFTVQGLWLDETGNNRQASLILDQPIWTGGRISSSISRAKAQNQAAVSGYQQAILEIMVDVSQSYREFHRLDRKVAILEEGLAKHRDLVLTMERRVRQEVSPLADLELVRSRTAQMEQQVATTIAQRLSTLQKLRELVGTPDLEPNEPPPTPPLEEFDGDELVARTLAFAPSLKRLKFEALAARAEAGVAKASIWPQLSGQYSYDDDYGHRVGLVLKAQSSGGLSSISNAAAARERQSAAELRVSAEERNLREQTLSDVAQYDSARSRMTSAGSAHAAAEHVTASYMRQFVSGRRTWLDVMNAVREATTAEGDAVDAEAYAYQAHDRLLMRGGGWPFPDDRETVK